MTPTTRDQSAPADDETRPRRAAHLAERLRLDDAGVVAIYVAIVLPVLMIFAAFAVDISRWYLELQRLQRTADAAALAAAPFMPETLTPTSGATVAALDQVRRNGYPNAAATVTAASRITQVKVTVSSTVQNGLASIIGFPTTALSRTAVGEFAGPAPLGSPCNVHGNEPWVSGTNQGSALPSPLPANCSNYPQFWSTIVGPEVYKTQGDRFAARKCGVNPYQESGCVTPGVGGANADYDPRGYVVMIRVSKPLTGSLTVQLYDPAYVDTGSTCDQLPAIGANNLGTNTYTNDATERYRNNPNAISATKPSYCTGDNDNSGLRFGNEVPTVTSFGLLAPTDTLNPFDPTVNTTNRVPNCAIQYPGFNKTGNGDNAWQRSAGAAAPAGNATQQLSNNNELTRLFHQWSTLCTISNPVVGDYYLRVRSNIPANNATGVFTQTADSAGVLSNGSNRFAVRAVPLNAADRSKVSVSPYERMPIFANSDGSTAVFNLVRVLPGSAGNSIDFSFFDVGDAGGAPGATLSVLTPTDSNIAAATGCTKSGFTSGADPDCSISGILNSNGWNGQRQQMTIPIPANYTCDFNDPFGCWWRLRVAFGGGVSVTDQTTWTATLNGDPVRLEE